MGKRIRIGKDIAIAWHITLPEDTDELLSDMDLTIAMKDPKGLLIAIKDYVVNGNDVLIGLKGTTFAWLGNYTLTLWKNKGKDGQTVVDAVNAFTLVNSTDKEADDNSSGSGVLEIKTVDLYSELTFLVNSAGANAGLTEKVALLEKRIGELSDSKQDNITLDDTPQAKSKNPVTSEGIKAYIDSSLGEVNQILEQLIGENV
ncbi:MAG: hypothetical protein E7077_06230 [Bacteroidales bacterium]|jgi:hypothetical protein|nr:hypothetical protein [Bacteroidales bacterium]